MIDKALREVGRVIRYALQSDAKTTRLIKLMIVVIIGSYLLLG
jgi:hypothetical protein